jgi:serine phosphatase RsbU (regulator of sigma subunit)
VDDPLEHIARLTRVLEITKHLAAERDLDHLLALIIDQARVAVGCERASLFLYDENHRQLYTCSMTHPQEIEEIRQSLDKGIIGLAARERRMVHVPDPYNHPLFNPEVDRVTGFRTQNILACPLVSWQDQKLLGVLSLLNKEGEGFRREDGDLLSVFASHAAIALDRAMLARHYKDAQLAGEIQAGFFPRRLPNIPGYEVAAANRPADFTGGDYYDVIPLEDGGVGLVIADVSGHGLPASLHMASARAVVRGLALRGSSPEDLLTDLNETLYEDLNPPGKRGRLDGITMAYGILDPAAHRFRFADAGHGPVFLHVQADSGRVVELWDDDDARGGVVGWVAGQRYRAFPPAALRPGDLLALGSDGLVETRREGEQFGVERLGRILLDGRGGPLPQLLDRVLKETTAFHEGPRPDDDLTLLLVRRLEH